MIRRVATISGGVLKRQLLRMKGKQYTETIILTLDVMCRLVLGKDTRVPVDLLHPAAFTECYYSTGELRTSVWSTIFDFTQSGSWKKYLRNTSSRLGVTIVVGCWLTIGTCVFANNVVYSLVICVICSLFVIYSLIYLLTQCFSITVKVARLFMVISCVV